MVSKQPNKLDKIQKITEELLGLLKIEAEVKVEEVAEDQTIKVSLETPDPGILIGFHGEAISALQLIIGMIAHKEFGDWQRVLVNVGDYLERREEVLRRMALSAAQKAKFSHEEVVLPSLSSAERRIIHMVLADHEDIISESQGEGRDRRLVIKPAK